MKRLVAGAILVSLAAAPLLVKSVDLKGWIGIHAESVQQATPFEAARFLTQATFGPTDDSIADVQSLGYEAWIDQQEAMPVSATHLAYLDARLAQLKLTNANAHLNTVDVYNSFWKQSVTAPDQLRQRVKLALSEIFVISLNHAGMDPRGVGSYYDMLGDNAFVNYRTLLEKITLHPMMGTYLNSLGSQKTKSANSPHPDQNYGREIQQLMSIGLYQLNIDGALKLDDNNQPIPTYTASDIDGLANVFTGYSWYSPAPSKSTFFGLGLGPDVTIKPMIVYSDYHSSLAKTFLGTTIPASDTPDAAGDLKIALDTIFNHPNVGPFLGRQLIQRLVTSNPSPAYVARVAAVFNDNGSGIRGDLGAVVKAILLDPEARDPANTSSPTFGKLREPIVRVANWMRAFNAISPSDWWRVGDTSDTVSLGQSVLNAPSVFNFWRPGYSPPRTAVGNLNLRAPEFEIVDEVSVSGYVNTMKRFVGNAFSDVQSAYANEIPLASDAGSLVNRIDILLFYGQMPADLRTKIVNLVNSVPIPAQTAGPDKIKAALTNRVELAIYLAISSPDYLTQR